MPCSCFKNSFLHRLLMCYYCTPEEERPKRKVRPPKGFKGGSSSSNNPNVSISSSGTAMYNAQHSKVLCTASTDVSDGLFLHRTGSQKSQAPSISAASTCSANLSNLSPAEEVTPEVLMAWVEGILSEDLVQEVNAVYKFVITESNKSTVYYLDLKNGAGSVGQGEPPLKPDVVLTSSLRNMQQLMSGKLSKMSAYLTGRLKVEGDKNAAYNLDKVILLVQQS